MAGGYFDMYRPDNVAYAHIDVRASSDNAIPHKYTYNTSTGTYQPYTENWWDSDSYHSIGVDGNVFKIDGSVIWNAGNDGAGSGLDADLLDGNHAAAFYLASNPSGYTTNTGTVTSVTVSAGSGLTGGGTVTTSGTVTLNIGAGTGITVNADDIALTVPVTVANGGTGATSFTAGRILFGNGTSAINTSANLNWDNTNGRLGINKTGQSYALDVVGQIQASQDIGVSDNFAFRLRGVADVTHKLFYDTGTTNNVWEYNATILFRFYNGGSPTNRFSFDTSGNLIASANITAYGSPSDERYKYNIKPIQNALNTILKLEGVTFNWKQDTDSYKMTKLDKDIGFIAQQVREVLPDLVRESEDGYLGLRERAIVPLLVEAIKELNKKIEKLEGKTT